MVLPERPRARRYPLSANIELIDVGTEAKIKQRTCDLSLFGCHVKTSTPWAVGTKVRLKITYKGSAFTAFGRVANVQEDGMGLEFSNTEGKNEFVLEIWVAELREEVAARK